MAQANWEADKMLDVYIYDYLLKRNLHASAKAFQAEGKVSTDPVAIDAPGGFLFEWWSVFWDIFIARTNEKHSEAAASYIETQVNKARELQQKPQQHPQMQMQHLLQRHAAQQQQQQHQQQQQQQHQQQQHPQHHQQQQQQRRDGTQLLNGTSNGLVGTDPLSRQNSATANVMATKMYEDRLKPPIQRDALDDAAMKQRLGDNMNQLMDSNRASLVKVATAGGQSSGQMLHGTPGGMLGNLQQAHNRSQQLPGLMQDIKSEMMNPRAAGPEGSLIGLHGSNEGSSNLTLKGWPLTVRPGILQQQNSMMQSSQPFNQLQLQQQLILQAQQNLASPSTNDLETRRLSMLLNRNIPNVDVPNVGSPVQVGCPVMPGADADMLMKQQQLQSNNQHQQQQQYSQHPFSSQHPQSSNQHIQQQEKITGAGTFTAGGSMSNSFQGNDQAPKNQMGRKRKQPVSSSGPANSSGTANTTGPSPSSPSTPSTHTAGDANSVPTLAHNSGSSKSLLMFASDGLGSVASVPNKLNDMDRFVDDGSLEDNVESFLSHDDADPRDRVARCSDVSKGFTFSEVGAITASSSKVECCHFSADGKTLATGGHDRKAVLWSTESFTVKSTLEEHSQWITDVRFSPSMSRLATSSADKTVRVWDVDNPGYSLRTFMGHSTTVMSLDFHPTKEDLLCSCDNNSEIRYWSIKNGSCIGVSKGGATQMRFQPRLGRMLAAAGDTLVSIIDVETECCTVKLQGHKNLVNSVCWDSSGEYLASVSDDSVRVWAVGSSSKGECLYELSCSGNKFQTCVFHPTYPSLLVIGCYETLELWNMSENKTMTLHAHDNLAQKINLMPLISFITSSSMKMRKKMPLVHSYRIENAEKMVSKALLLFLLFQLCTSRDTMRGNEEQLKDVDGDYLVSKESKFELGFFSPGNSSNRYVGVWYSQTRVSNKTVVWVANRNNPINDTSGVLTINRYGELVLYARNMESTPIWSTNVSRSVQNVNTSTSSTQLLDTGNLVVFQDDKNEIFIWQSFDHPIDTLIPGMKVGVNWKTGQEWVLTSWKSQDDPGTGDYTYRLSSDHNASPQFFLYKGLSKYWRSDPGPAPTLVANQDETYYFMNETNTITRITVTDSALEHLIWDGGGLQWKEDFSAPKSRCDRYGQCGANSRCSPDNVNLFECDCLPGYVPNSVSDWNQKNGSGGCVSNRLGLLKCGDGDGFIKVARVKYPDTSIAASLKSGMSDKECAQECLRNCSCTAYLSTENEGIVDCLTWYDDLMDILVYTELGRDLYVRVNATVLAANAGRSQGFLERRGMLAIPILSTALALVLIIMLAWKWRKKNRNTRGIDFVEAEELEETQRHPELQFFDLDTIIAATDHFSRVNELGRGGFGSVYKGQLSNEQKVAVKRLSKTSGQGIEEFKNEVALIARLQHRNLVKLLGCCIKGEERMLVLEYMPNKGLDSFLFDKTRRSFLDWEKRFEIINGIARGILYLHQDSRLRIIHRDLKTSNVLLDDEMNPKISDFGMARIFHGDQLQDKTSRIVGTYGYMSPEYAVFGRFSTKSDVFSFGIIMLEIVSGQKNNGSDLEDPSVNLIGRVWELWREGRALDIVDSTLKSYHPNEAMRCIQVALLCVQEDPKDRPAMSAIVFMLSDEASPPLPKQPAFIYRRNFGTNVDPLLSNRSSSINDLTATTMEAR